MKKKIAALCMGVLLSTIMMSCINGNAETVDTGKFSLDKVNTVEGCCSYTVNSVIVDKKITPMNNSEKGVYYEVFKEGYVYLDLVLDVTSSKEKETADKLITVNFQSDGKSYSTSMVVERGNELIEAKDVEVASNETVTIHYYSLFKERDLEKEVEAQLEVGGNKYFNNLKLEKSERQKYNVSCGDTLLKDNYAEMKIENMKFQSKLETAESTSYHKVYEVSDGNNIFLVVKATVKNLSNKEIEANKIATVNALTDNGTIYEAMAIVEEDSGVTLNLAETKNIPSMGSESLYYLIQVPKNLEKENFKIQVTLDGKEYLLKK